MLDLTKFFHLLQCRALQTPFISKPLHTVYVLAVISARVGVFFPHNGLFPLKLAVVYCICQHHCYFEPVRTTTTHPHWIHFLFVCFKKTTTKNYTHYLTKLEAGQWSEDNHMLTASSVCKWLSTLDGNGHSDKSSHKQSYAPSWHPPDKLEINMIPLLSTQISMPCPSGLVQQHPNSYSQSFGLEAGQSQHSR